ncbi:MAG: recombinase RecA [Clostridia bacterium]
MEEKKKLLDQAILNIEKQFGKGSIMRLGDQPAQMIDVIPSGCLALDMALGIGGIPRGRIIEIYGPESSGKTTCALHILAEAQKLGGTVAFIDAEHALDPSYAKRLGVNVEDLYVSQPDNGEQALDICEALVRTSSVDVVVVDSVAALTPKAEIEGDMGGNHVGLQARLMSQALRKLTAITSKSKTCVIFINQLREKIGVMFGSPETTTGGKALKFYASIRLDVRKVDTIKDGTNIIGNRTKIKVVKNKLAPPFKIAEFDIIYGEGISKSGSVLDLALLFDLVQKAGSWFAYKGEKIGQGKENAKAYIQNNAKVYAELETQIRKLMKEKQIDMEDEPAED